MRTAGRRGVLFLHRDEVPSIVHGLAIRASPGSTSSPLDREPMDFLKSTYERAGLILCLVALLALLGYGHAADKTAQAKYRCDALRTTEAPQPCPET